jgi:hypothetical protein
MRGVGCLGLAVVLAGCTGGPPDVPAPTYSPQEGARLALEDYDTDKDGKLDAAELERCASLREGLAQMDKDRDHCLSGDEIAERLIEFESSNIRLLSIPCRVVREGEPLARATVKLVPERFMGPGLKPATGVSDNFGQVNLQVEGMPVSGAACGFYRVDVSLMDAAGVETLPARYNTQTTLGLQVSPVSREILIRLR